MTMINNYFFLGLYVDWLKPITPMIKKRMLMNLIAVAAYLKYMMPKIVIRAAPAALQSRQ